MKYSLRRSLFYSTALTALMTAGSNGAVAVSVLGGGSTLAALDYDLELPPAFTYCSIGSGAGTSAFVSNIDAPLNADTTTCKTITGKAVDYGASDAYISSANVTTFASSSAGPLIQIPMFGTPVTFAYHLGTKTDGQEKLTEAQVCGILGHQITDWHTIDSTVAAGTTIEVAYRLDSSGTTFLTTNFLKAVCPVVNSSAFTPTQLATMPTTTFAASLYPGGVPSNFIGGTGSSGVEAIVHTTSNSIGYLSPDYTDISVDGAADGYPAVVSVINHNVTSGTSAFLPTVSNTSLALGTITAPTGAAETTQSNWAPLVPDPKSGYPVAGYTYWFTATCYSATKSAGVAADLISFLQTHYNVSDTTAGKADITTITNSGFVPVTGSTSTANASAFAAAINTVFLVGDTEHLNISNTGTGATNSTCKTGVTGR